MGQKRKKHGISMPQYCENQFLPYGTQFFELQHNLICVSTLFSIRNKMMIKWWTLNTHKHIILLLLLTTTLQYFEKPLLLHTNEFLELLQKRTCDSIVNSYRNKTLIVLLLYLTSKRCFRTISFTSKVRDGLVTVLLLNWRVLHDILHMKTLV